MWISKRELDRIIEEVEEAGKKQGWEDCLRLTEEAQKRAVDIVNSRICLGVPEVFKKAFREYL